MIRLTRLNGKEFVLNSDLIKLVEATPDTVITLTQGDKLMVRESVDQVVQGATEYRKKLFSFEFINRNQN
ncbi:MAG: flagellar FlbD family protein [Bdellovibrio sp.]|nr:flagellar FlbD family protein [Bdellovibrio sp.]